MLQAALNAAAGPHPTYVTKCSSASHCGRSAGKHVLSLCATFLSGPLNAVTTRNVRHLPFLQYLTNGRGIVPTAGVTSGWSGKHARTLSKQRQVFGEHEAYQRHPYLKSLAL